MVFPSRDQGKSLEVFILIPLTIEHMHINEYIQNISENCLEISLIGGEWTLRSCEYETSENMDQEYPTHVWEHRVHEDSCVELDTMGEIFYVLSRENIVERYIDHMERHFTCMQGKELEAESTFIVVSLDYSQYWLVNKLDDLIECDFNTLVEAC